MRWGEKYPSRCFFRWYTNKTKWNCQQQSSENWNIYYPFLKISNQSSLNVLVFITIKLVLVNSLNINMEFKFNSIEIIIWQLINILKLRNITCPFQAKIFFNEKSFREGIKGFVWVFFSDGMKKKKKNFMNCHDVSFLSVLERYFEISFHEMSLDQDENCF